MRVLSLALLVVAILIAACDVVTDPAIGPHTTGTTTTTQVAPTTTTVQQEAPTPTTAITTTTVPTPVAPAGSRCPNFYDEALAAGWPASSWKRIDYIMFRESRCDASAHNPRDPGYGSFGLMQLNMSKGQYGTWALFGPILGGDMTRLYNPLTNLSAARTLFLRAQQMWGCGWKPWGFRC